MSVRLTLSAPMLIITGTIAWDYIMEFPGKFGDHILPEHIHNVNLSFIVNKYAKRRGGTAGNVSYSLGLLKTPHILYTAVGKDFDEYKKAFTKVGIATNKVFVDAKDATATGFAMTDKSNNQIWGYYYGAAEKKKTLPLKNVATQTSRSGQAKNDLVLIGPQGAEGSMHFVNECIALNIPYMLDPGFILTQVSDADLARGITNAAYVIGNEYEMEVIAKRVKNWKTLQKEKIVITTLSEKGATIVDKGKVYTIAPIPNVGVASTTGAGDSWRSGFLAGLQRGFDLQTCGQMGAVAAGFTVEHFGTQEHSFTLKEFQDRYRKSFGSMIRL
ncbi:MAG TPA: PfkB family carbohydrate kinase [Candidatus Eisenbacteria bacterium]|nr:PfkB family carbohydrate kinase [Candidatus Eisenbacteria bacterium]